MFGASIYSPVCACWSCALKFLYAFVFLFMCVLQSIQCLFPLLLYFSFQYAGV